MPDCRPPVSIALTGLKMEPMDVSLEWTGSRGPVRTGDNTKFVLVIHNKDPKQQVNGLATLQGILTSSITLQGARPSNTISYRVDPGGTGRFAVPDHWMFVEGKFSWVLTSLIVNGIYVNVGHPLASITVFERSTYDSQTRNSWATLLVAIVAAAGSLLAAVFAFLLLVK